MKKDANMMTLKRRLRLWKINTARQSPGLTCLPRKATADLGAAMPAPAVAALSPGELRNLKREKKTLGVLNCDLESFIKSK